MLQHSFGKAVFFSQYCIAPVFDIMPCLQARGTRDCNKGTKFKKGAVNCCNETKISFNSIWACLYVFELQRILLYKHKNKRKGQFHKVLHKSLLKMAYLNGDFNVKG